MNFNNSKFKPGLYCVATPIGNMGDISLRSINILKESELILCEDTRVTKKILQKFDITKKMISNHKFNETRNLQKVIEILKDNKIVSIVSDAGTPAISDPGRILVNECIKNKIRIFPIPGASAVTAAISVSGFTDNFYFCGFLPEKNVQVRKLFNSLMLFNCSIVFFISPNKFDKRINDIKEFFPNRELLICREITKFHEEYIRVPVKQLSNLNFSRKGELTVVISELKKENLSFNQLEESDKKKIDKLIKKMSIKDIIKKVTEDKKISKKLVYNYCLEKKK